MRGHSRGARYLSGCVRGNRNGVRLARKMMQTPAFSAVLDSELHPGAQVQVPV